MSFTESSLELNDKSFFFLIMPYNFLKTEKCRHIVYEAARTISAVWKTHSCKSIPNWARDRMIIILHCKQWCYTSPFLTLVCNNIALKIDVAFIVAHRATTAATFHCCNMLQVSESDSKTCNIAARILHIALKIVTCSVLFPAVSKVEIVFRTF